MRFFRATPGCRLPSRLSAVSSHVAKSSATSLQTLQPLSPYSLDYDLFDARHSLKTRPPVDGAPYLAIPDALDISPALRQCLLDYPCSPFNPRRSSPDIHPPGLSPVFFRFQLFSRASLALLWARALATLRIRAEFLKFRTTALDLDEGVFCAHYQAIMLAIASGDYSDVASFIAPAEIDRLKTQLQLNPLPPKWRLASSRVVGSVVGIRTEKEFQARQGATVQCGASICMRFETTQSMDDGESIYPAVDYTVWHVAAKRTPSALVDPKAAKRRAAGIVNDDDVARLTFIGFLNPAEYASRVGPV